MDRIVIRNLRLRCIIGIYPEERAHRQDVVFTISLETDLREAGATDRMDDTVNYRTLKKKIVEEVESSSFNLLERLARHVADLCLEDERVRRVTVSLDKPGALRFADSVAVEITREQGGG